MFAGFTVHCWQMPHSLLHASSRAGSYRLPCLVDESSALVDSWPLAVPAGWCSSVVVKATVQATVDSSHKQWQI